MIKQGLKLGGRALSTYILGMVLCLLLCASIGGEWYWAQVLLNLALLAGMGLLMFNDGGYRGERACTMTATVERMNSEGKQPSSDMLGGQFDKRVAVVGFLVCALPLLIVAGVNLIAEPYYPPVIVEETDLTLEEQAEQYEALSDEEKAALQAEAEATPTNWPNVVTRVVFMPFVSVFRPFGQNPHGLNLLFVLLAMLASLPAPIGYLCGPMLRRKKLIDIEKGKKRKLRKLKVHQKPKEPRKPKMEV